MKNRFLLSPYFLDSPAPGLMPLADPTWKVISAPLPAGEKQQRMISLYRPLRDFVAGAVSQGERPVSIAGDCCTSLGVLAGLQKAGVKPTLIWLDAHGDFNTWETTPSGFLGGMPLAMMVGRGEQTMAEGVGLSTLEEESVILSDARDLDPGERASLENSAIVHVPNVADLLATPLPPGPLWVHFDVDVLNPEEVPAVSYLAWGGPSVSTMRRLFRRLAQSGRVVSVSVSAWNPELEGSERSREVVMGLVNDIVS